MSIKPIDKTSIHRITSGQVVIDLQTAVKELVENSLDAGATNLGPSSTLLTQYGLSTIEVIDNGCGISEENYEGLALKNHTSKLSSFEDLSTVTTFGFRGEALSSLCALCDSVVVSTAVQPPMGVSLEMESSGKIAHKGKRHLHALQRGTTITLTKLFSTLPVRRKEFERNAKREFGKALTLLNAYALGPCSSRAGVRLTVSNQLDKGQKSVQIRTPGIPSLRASVSSLWGPKALDNIVDLDLSFVVERDKIAMKRAPDSDDGAIAVVVRGLVSKFAIACGRTGTDRQFFFVNGRPCSLSKVQKAFNEVYRSFNAMQSPFIIADLIIPTDSCDINVSPDKRSIFLHHETNLISALKVILPSQRPFPQLISAQDNAGNLFRLLTFHI
ncbi:histidine kinase-like ATPase [Mycena rebaudengoi]|nr:histidine kinase-like ATPase [Mycena rebaudengoi]